MSVFRDSFSRTHTISGLIQLFSEPVSEAVISTAGRVMARRDMGKTVFFDLKDGSGKIQCCASGKKMDPSTFELVKNGIKVGDIVGVSGTLFITRTGEKTISVGGATLLTSAQRSPPEKFHGFSDQESRYRKRYLDLIMNDSVLEIFQTRARMIHHIRQFLSNESFVEVETPVFQRSPCGASARPFITHHNALNMDFYLRISPETFLKQLITGGMDRVFEIGKDFRNEGIDPSHLQEFTMLEYYASYWNYLDNMAFIQRMLRTVIQNTVGTLKLNYQGTELDFASEWRVVKYRELVFADCGIDVLAYTNVDDLWNEIEKKGIDLGETREDRSSLGNLIDKLYKKVSRPKLIQPTVLMNHPASLIPLARLNGDDPRVIDSFQVLVSGWEIVKAYSELADPVLQRKLLEEQAKHRELGDEEAMFLDEDFLTSLEYGMPPVSGLGLGIDRLAAILSGRGNLREVTLFPLMK